MSEVTHILSAIAQGDPHAASQLLPLVYDELRLLAAQKLTHEWPGQTLDATALVHEAYLRLVGERQFAGSRHFFAAAAEGCRLPSDAAAVTGLPPWRPAAASSAPRFWQPAAGRCPGCRGGP